MYQSVLFRPQRDHGILPRGHLGRDNAGDQRQHHRDAHQDHPGRRRQRRQVRDPRHRLQDHVGDHHQQQRHRDADHPGREAHDQRLRVEHPRHVLPGGADGAQDADLLRPLQHADVRDDPDHDRGYHQADGHKRDQHIADGVHDRRHAGHHNFFL